MTLKSSVAFVSSKLSYHLLKLLGRNATSFPGDLALKIDKDYLKHVKVPANTIAVTGTNGKTTTVNMINDILKYILKKDICNNNMGSNIDGGIASALNLNLNFFGGIKSDTCVLEVDEKFTPVILTHVKPKVFTIINLYQDSYKRNAHPYYVKDIISRAIPNDTMAVLNADDLISSDHPDHEKKVAFSVLPLEGEVSRPSYKLGALKHCPRCGEDLEYSFLRYHHIGQAHCKACSFKNLDAKYKVLSRDVEKMEIRISDDQTEYTLPLFLNNLETIYNEIASYATLREFGIEADKLVDAFKNISVTKSRYDKIELPDRDVSILCAKYMNPIANSRIIDFLVEVPSKDKNKGKTILFANDTGVEGIVFSEILGWLYETDFELLKDDSIDRVIFMSWKHEDMMVRCILAGVDENKLRNTYDVDEAIDMIDYENTGDIYILNSLDPESIKLSFEIRDKILQRLGK